MKWYHWLIIGVMCALLLGFIVLQIWAGIYYWNTPASEVPWWVWWITRK